MTPESNDRYVEVLESDDFVEKRSDDLRDRMETFYGDITDEQMKKIVKLTQTKDEVRTYLAQQEVSQTYCLDLIVKGEKSREIGLSSKVSFLRILPILGPSLIARPILN